jgi:hypothetical protein
MKKASGGPVLVSDDFLLRCIRAPVAVPSYSREVGGRQALKFHYVRQQYAGSLKGYVEDRHLDFP